MGAVLGAFSFASWVPCLCSGASCLMCSCCPSSRNSTVIRIIYAFILLLGTIVACIMLSPGVDQQLKRVTGQIAHVSSRSRSCFLMVMLVMTNMTFFLYEHLHLCP